MVNRLGYAAALLGGCLPEGQRGAPASRPGRDKAPVPLQISMPARNPPTTSTVKLTFYFAFRVTPWRQYTPDSKWIQGNNVIVGASALPCRPGQWNRAKNVTANYANDTNGKLNSHFTTEGHSVA